MGSDDKGGDKGLGGLLRGFTDLIGKLGELAESGESLSKTGSFDLGRSSGGAAGKPSKGVFGLSVKVGGLGGKEVEIEPFGNIRRDQQTGESSVDDTREPLVDVFDEDDRLLIIAEMPGIDADGVRVDVTAGVLTLSGERDQRRYRKSIQVPDRLRREDVAVSCNNGIIEISYAKT